MPSNYTDSPPIFQDVELSLLQFLQEGRISTIPRCEAMHCWILRSPLELWHNIHSWIHLQVTKVVIATSRNGRCTSIVAFTCSACFNFNHARGWLIRAYANPRVRWLRKLVTVLMLFTALLNSFPWFGMAVL
jgi:hypothetical protein